MMPINKVLRMYRLLCMSATPNSSISLKRAFYFTATVDGGSFQSKLVYTVVHITVTCNTERFLYSKAIWRVAHSVMPLGGGEVTCAVAFGVRTQGKGIWAPKWML